MSLRDEPEVVFDARSTDSPRSRSPTDITITTSIKDSVDHDAGDGRVLRPLTTELDGMRTVALTPVDEKPPTVEPASPPLVLKSIPTTPIDPTPDTRTIQATHSDDEDDPRALVIASLRTQISDLFSQVSLLNTKLVQSYDRVSELEETLDENHEKFRALDGERMNLEREKEVLEREKEKHDEMLRDGRLVERKAVAEEMTRLMEESIASTNAKLTAEAKRAQIESELSDLSANLFSAANDMVVKERQLRSSVEDALAASVGNRTALETQLKDRDRRIEEGEKNLDALKEERSLREVEMNELRRAVQSMNSVNIASQGSGVIRMMNSHLPFKGEYLSFISHLRTLFPTTPNPPSLSSLLTLPFLQRLATEDSEPTLRLDLAPALNWLTRRSVLAAIHANTLRIEQIHVATLFLENSTSTYSYSGFGSGSAAFPDIIHATHLNNTTGTSLPTSPTQLTKVTCALCGKTVYMSPEAIQAEEQHYQNNIVSQSPITATPTTTQQPMLPSRSRTDSGGGWAATKFLKGVNLSSFGGSGSDSGTNTPVRRRSLEVPNATPPNLIPSLDRPPSPPPPTSLQTLIHSFRVPLANKGSGAADTNEVTENYGPPYPLCHTGWCVSRLKATFELWSFVKSGIVERVWQEARSINLKDHIEASEETLVTETNGKLSTPIDYHAASSPVAPAVKKKMANLWDMGRGAFDKAMRNGSPSASSPASDQGLFSTMRRTLSAAAAPTPPPSTPPKQDVAKSGTQEEKKASLSEEPETASDTTNDITQTRSAVPPPLPKRSSGHANLVAEKVKSHDGLHGNSGDDTIKENQGTEGTRTVPDAAPLVVEPSTVDDTISAEPKIDRPHPLPLLDVSNTTNDPELVTPTPFSTGFPASSQDDDQPKTELSQPIIEPSKPLSTDMHPIPPVSSEGTKSKSDEKSAPDGPPSRPATPSDPSIVRPSTPSKPAGIPPPLPRRAAARNAARSSMVHARKASAAEEKNVPASESTPEKAIPAEKSESDAPANAPVVDASVEDQGTSGEGAQGVEKVEVEPVPQVVDADTTLTSETLKDQSHVPQHSEPDTEDGAEVTTPKSVSMPLPPLEMPSPSQHPVPSLPVFVAEDDGSADLPVSTRPRQGSAVSSSSDYSQSVYTTHSAQPATGDDKAHPPPVPDKTHSSNHIAQMFYVGRGTWEERAWLELVRIRENMFWARLGGVRH
ncbi:hypothetical protein FRC17_011238 [Serendipita sp. 399]|nr:hypothetical protein FRC17_011238 [Serendipita sp. 399]